MNRTPGGEICLSVFVALAIGCYRVPVLTQLLEARQLAADLRLQLNKAADASNRAVMANTDEASAAAARESEDVIRLIQRDTEALWRILRDLEYGEEIRLMKEFEGRFNEYRTLDRTIRALAVENTNFKAQELAFGPAREAAEAFRRSLGAVFRSAVNNKCDIELLVSRAIAAVRQIQLLEAPHIAESDEAEMSRLEAQMATAETEARQALSSLRTRARASADLDAATAALDRFKAINVELVGLSRRNSDVRSLALSLGRKRTLTAACDDTLQALHATLHKHEFTATR